MNILMTNSFARSASSSRRGAWRLSGNILRYILASVVLFLGLSVANAFGGWLQSVFYGICLAIALTSPHRMPMVDILLAVVCGVIAVVVSLRIEPSLAPFVKIIRPFIEGYLLAILIYKKCYIRTFRSLMIVLAGYVLLAFISFNVMLMFPDLRSKMLELWYSDDAYQQGMFQQALLFRGYGISRHHLFGLPLAMGTVSAMLLVAGSLNSPLKWRIYFIASALCGLIVVLLNARIGIIPIVFCYFFGVGIFFNRYYFKQLIALIFILLPIIFLVAQFYLGDLFELISAWLLEGVLQFYDPGTASDSNTVSDLSAMVFLPTDLSSWLIGGGRLCEVGEACYSDIGWIRLLQEGGLALTATVTALYIRAIFLLCRNFSFIDFLPINGSISTTRRLLFGVLALTFIAATIKGDSFGANEYSRLIMMLGVLSSLVSLNSRYLNQTKGSRD